MFSYILKRLLLIFPTIFGIILINFVIVQFAPGGPVENVIAQITGSHIDATANFTSGGSGDFSGAKNNLDQVSQLASSQASSKYTGSQGLDPELLQELEQLYGFDKSPSERFWTMVKNYLMLDFGESFFKEKKVVDLVIEKLPVSISLGLWTTLIVYLISIPLGIKKAVSDGSKFDIWTSSIISIGYAIPGFLFAILLIVLFAGGSYWQIFPLRGLTSDNWGDLGLWGKTTDYLWHIAMPVLSMVIGGFASLTFLCKNSFIEELRKQYVLTARAKGLGWNEVLYGHVFRNAMLIVIAGFPSAFVGILFTSSLLIEIVFSLDGLGLLGYEAVIGRDYPVIFGTLFIYSLIGLILNIIGDVTYSLVDPRIDFEKR